MLSVLQLGLILSVLVLQSVFFGFNKVFVVTAVTVQLLGVQVDDICYYGIEEVSVMGDDQDGGLPCLWEELVGVISSGVTVSSVPNEDVNMIRVMIQTCR